jgi:hypothetical protein
MPKIKPNDICSCMSGLKYKKCCAKNIKPTKYETGQLLSSKVIKDCIDYLQIKFPNNRFIDITEDLTEDSYKEYQIKNYNTNITMIAEKTNNNNTVFLTRVDKDTSNIILMHRGAYRTFNNMDIDRIIDSLKSFI